MVFSHFIDYDGLQPTTEAFARARSQRAAPYLKRPLNGTHLTGYDLRPKMLRWPRGVSSKAPWRGVAEALAGAFEASRALGTPPLSSLEAFLRSRLRRE
jgi:hypothetical protein